MEEDNYTATVLASSSEMTPLLTNYPFCQSSEFAALPYPRTLVFSGMVPKIYMAIRDYIDACFSFVESMDLAWTELEDVLNRATNSLFTDCLNSMLERTIQSCESDLLRLVQLTINLNELESACEYLQTYLHEHARPRFGGGDRGGSSAGLTAVSRQLTNDLEDSEDPVSFGVYTSTLFPSTLKIALENSFYRVPFSSMFFVYEKHSTRSSSLKYFFCNPINKGWIKTHAGENHALTSLFLKKKEKRARLSRHELAKYQL